MHGSENTQTRPPRPGWPGFAPVSVARRCAQAAACPGAAQPALSPVASGGDAAGLHRFACHEDDFMQSEKAAPEYGRAARLERGEFSIPSIHLMLAFSDTG